jgi:hypothetical protein
MAVKSGVDAKGFFTIIYGPGGIKWARGEEALRIAKQAGLKGVGSSDFTGSGYLSAACQITKAIAQLGMWYEMRQMRQLEEARFEERRLDYLVSCASLVLNDMRTNGRLDAKETFYLSREAQGLFEAAYRPKSKLHIPGTILYMCHRIHRSLAEFNAASYEVLSSKLRSQGVLTTQRSIFGEELGKLFGGGPVPNDTSWLEYHSAEEQLEAALAFARENKSAEVNWKDIAKSAVLLAAFVPIPLFWGAGVARAFITIGGLAAGNAAALYSIQPLYRLLRSLSKNKREISEIDMLEEYQDLLLLQFEAANTSRMISVQARLLEGMEQNSAILVGYTPMDTLPAPGEATGAGEIGQRE